MSEHKEIKIIAIISENGILQSPGVKVFIDDEIIGCIRDIKFHASADRILSELEITFPDLDNYMHNKCDESCNEQIHSLYKKTDGIIKKLKSIIGIKVNIDDIFKS